MKLFAFLMGECLWNRFQLRPHFINQLHAKPHSCLTMVQCVTCSVDKVTICSQKRCFTLGKKLNPFTFHAICAFDDTSTSYQLISMYKKWGKMNSQAVSFPTVLDKCSRSGRGFICPVSVIFSHSHRNPPTIGVIYDKCSNWSSTIIGSDRWQLEKRFNNGNQ